MGSLLRLTFTFLQDWAQRVCDYYVIISDTRKDAFHEAGLVLYMYGIQLPPPLFTDECVVANEVDKPVPSQNWEHLKHSPTDQRPRLSPASLRLIITITRTVPGAMRPLKSVHHVSPRH